MHERLRNLATPAGIAGGLLGGFGAGTAAYALLWHVFPCAVAGTLAGALVFAWAFPREAAPPCTLENVGAPRMPRDLIRSFSYKGPIFVQMTLACETALWSLSSTETPRVDAAVKQVAQGTWPQAGEIVPWERVCRVEQHRYGGFCTIVKHREDHGEVKKLVIWHNEERELLDLEGTFRRMIRCPWDHEEPREAALIAALPVLVFLTFCLTLTAAVMIVAFVVPTEGPGPKLTLGDVAASLGGIVVVFMPLIAIRVATRPTYVVLTPNRADPV